MSRIRLESSRAGLITVVLAFSGALASAQGGRVRARPRAGVAHHRAVQQAPLHLGDVSLSRFVTLSFVPGKRAVVRGADTLVETADPSQPNAVTRLQASEIVAYLLPNTNQAERVEANGNVRFSGTRPAPGGGVQSFRGTGTKGTYLRSARRVTLQGPVSFSSEQTVDGGSQTVSGTSGEATYDEAKQHLSLTGDVDLTITDPSIKGPGKIQGDEVDVNLAAHPYEIEVRNNQRGNKGIQFQPKQGTKKGG